MIPARALFALTLVWTTVHGQSSDYASSSSSSASGRYANGDCICPKFYQPVCGRDGGTYGNGCEAKCAGTTVKCQGKCPCPGDRLCKCPKYHRPVCGTDGKAYPNKDCTCGVEVACEGTCPCPDPACICPADAKPVCGANGQTYNNACLAGCAKVPVKCDKTCPCKDECICTEEFNPVCGKNGVQYDNACKAKCAKVEVKCHKKCPCVRNCAPVVLCEKNPCDGAKCPAHPKAVCKPDYCLGCNKFDFFIGDKKVNCNKPDGCFCTLQYDPVCGTDGKKYGNACQAGCAKTKVACKGECPCKPKECDGEIYSCLVDPCERAECDAFPDATCVPNYCGGCFAEFFDKNGNPVNCDKTNDCVQKGNPCSPLSANRRAGTHIKKCCGALKCCPPCRPHTGFDTPATRTTVAAVATCEDECRLCLG